MKKKGFTLIEIIISLTLIISVSVITIIILNKNKVNNKDDKKQKELEAAVDVIADKLRTKNSLKEFVVEEDDTSSEVISYFCLTKETLISEGILTEESEILKSIKSDEYVKVSQDQVGTFVYEHPVKIEDCTYINSIINNSEVENTEEKVIDKLSEEENGFYLSQHLIPKENVNNTYEFKMNFKFNTGKLNDSSYKPNIYTVFVVDGSGSMSTAEFNKVVDASINLSKTLTDTNVGICNSSNSCNYVSAISFDDNIDKNIDFKTSVLTVSDFKRGGGLTSYKNAFSAAYNRIKDKTYDNNRFFIIFLTDGLNNGGSYTTQLNYIKNFLKPTGSAIEYGKLITVGFKISDSTLIDIASSNCNGEGTNCYYEASSSDIGKVYESFFNVIKKEVMCSTYKKSKISIELSDNFKFVDGSNIKNIEENLDCNEEDFTNEIQTQKLIDNALYDLTFIKPDNDDLEVGTHEFSIINKISIKFFDADNNELSEILLNKEDFPTVKLDIDNVSVVN